MISFLIALVVAEGYFCPYESIGYEGINDLLYDYYNTTDGGSTWTRMGEVGWTSRESYCAEKGDLDKHSDAGQEKCQDSMDKCVWTDDACTSNIDAVPDCIELCQAVIDGNGPECLGDSCGSREDFYAICDGIVSDPVPVIQGICVLRV